MQKIKYLIPIILFFLLLNIKSASADAYVLHLYYNATSKTLSFDKFASENISLDKTLSPSVIDFTQESETSSGQYILTFYDSTNNEIISTQFNKKDGTFQLTIPYFSIGASLKIFDKTSKKELLSANLSNFVTCNGNGICEIEKGENALNCMEDCANGKPDFSEQTSNELKNNNGVIKDSSSGEILLSDPALIPSASAPTTSSGGRFSIFILILGIFIFVGTIGFLVYKKFIKKD